MDDAVIIRDIVLDLFVLATAAKFLDWLMHTDPQTMMRVSRWMSLLLFLACIPLVAWMVTDSRRLAAIHAAHARRSRLVHPDHANTSYFARKVDRARNTLLRPSRERFRLSTG